MRLAFLVLLSVFGIKSLALQDDTSAVRPKDLRLAELDGNRVLVHGLGLVQGLGIREWGASAIRLCFRDDSSFSEPGFDDRGWHKFVRVDSLDRLDSALCWLRYHFKVDSSLDLNTIELHMVASGRTDVWLDGALLLHHDMSSRVRHVPTEEGRDTAAFFMVPVPVRSDGKAHVLAMRLQAWPGGTPPFRALQASLHRTAASARTFRNSTHLSAFIAINVFILIMALLFWRLDRHDRIWPWFAALTATNAFIAFTELAQNLDVGFGPGTVRILGNAGDALEFAPMTIAVLLLVVLLGQATRRMWRLYSGSALIINLLIIGAVFSMRLNKEDSDQMDLLIGLIIGLLAVVPAIWFVIETVRLGIRVIRSKGFQRWIGGGILIGIILPILLQMIYGLIDGWNDGFGRVVIPEGVQNIADYVAYVAIPLCIIIALAIRTSHQNRLLARQRDDLDKEVHERTAELRMERDRSENLLLNILPQEVADELKQTGSAEARHFDLATVLFSDFKGFTEMSGTMPPAELLQELNACFRAFDDIIGKRGIEKIKTIGDAYMCAGGLPDPKNADPVAVVMAALEMQEFMQQRERQRSQAGLFAFQMRLGIHSGPVVAGIVGVKKFQYDIWGDTVNMASRMETNGETGRVNISASTFELVKDQPGLAFHPRGTVVVKGKGATEMWFVERA